MDNMKILKEACWDLLKACKDFKGDFSICVNEIDVNKNNISEETKIEIKKARISTRTIEEQIKFLLDKDYCDSVYAAAKNFIRIYENENQS